MLKAIPNAFTDFASLIDEDYVFIDKTRFLQVYEESKTKVSLFLRPRRFGKTMFTELLRYYYDKALESESDRLFKGHYIASHPTPLKSSFYVLQFDFSGIDTSGSNEEILDGFTDNIVSGIDEFFSRYPELILSNIRRSVPDGTPKLLKEAVLDYYNNRVVFSSPSKLIRDFLRGLPLEDSKLLVIIDEYDNFANDVLSRDPKAFGDLARKGGAVSAFYQVLRSWNQKGIIDRIFVTGVLPVTMDTGISGFVSQNLSTDQRFNELAGFTDDEVMELLRQTVDFEKCRYSLEELRDVMKRRYNGYRFAEEAKNSVYNATLCLNFIEDLKQRDYKRIPDVKIFSNASVDYTKLSGFLKLINEKDRRDLLSALNNHVPVKAEVDIPVKLTSDHDTLSYVEGVSLLFNMGFLTIMSQEELEATPDGSYLKGPCLRIPNDYFETLFSGIQLEDSSDVLRSFEKFKNISRMAEFNDISALTAMLEEIAGAFIQTDNSKEGETQIGLAVYTALNLVTNGRFLLRREYPVKIDGKFVFEDGLDEDEYEDPVSDAPENESTPGTAQDQDLSEEELEDARAARILEEMFGGSAGTKTALLDTTRGRADLLATNTGKGPSYIFEFKYRRNGRVRETTRLKVVRTLYERAVKQLNFYVRDDKIRAIPDLHKYVIMYAYGRFYIRETE